MADVFRQRGPVYAENHFLTPVQHKAVRNIIACRTEALGGHVDVCTECGHRRPSYNSCRDRHCPKCQSLSQARWIARRKHRILPTHHFHVVFTLPAQLRPLALSKQKLVYKLLFKAASATLLDLAKDKKRLGAQLGITAVLHTWTRDLRYHPHLHCIVTGGGLSPSGRRWIPAKRRFLFPREVLSRLFRGKFMDGLVRAYKNGDLDPQPCFRELTDASTFEVLKQKLYRKEWVVYSKATFCNAEKIFQYLGRYTHRVAISNHRLISFDGRHLTFATKNSNTETLQVDEFIRRFLLHILPGGFTKIRHYGLMAPGNVNSRLKTARRLLQPQNHHDPDPLPQSWQELLMDLTGIDVTVCPRCNKPTMIRYKLETETSSTPAQPEYCDTS